MTDVCTVPPEGWWCSRDAGHDGPCAARPIEADDKLARLATENIKLALIIKEVRKLTEHADSYLAAQIQVITDAAGRGGGEQ